MSAMDLDAAQEEALFEKYPIFDKIGMKNFGIKLWILLKGIQNGTGEGVLVTALGHKPCIAMLEDDVQPQEIIDILDELIENNIISWEDKHTVFTSRKYIVTFETSHELNKIILQLDLIKFLGTDMSCMKILQKLGFKNVGNATRAHLINQGKRVLFWLNNENGLGTAKLIQSALWDAFVESSKSGF